MRVHLERSTALWHKVAAAAEVAVGEEPENPGELAALQPSVRIRKDPVAGITKLYFYFVTHECVK